MSKRKTTEEFMAEARVVHGDRYDYSQVEYVNGKVKVTIVCREHGPFEQGAISHLRGTGCPKCGVRRVGDKRRGSTEKFIVDACSIHGDRYDYSQVEYVGARAKVTIICPEHGPFEQLAISHTTGSGCPECRRQDKYLTTAEFITKARAIHGDLYDYSQTKYVDGKTKVTIICREHGPFEQTPVEHKTYGRGCQKCSVKVRGYKRRNSMEKVIAKARAVHGDRYDYSQVEYVNTHTKVTILCREHGPFEQNPQGHMRGAGCPECGHKDKGDRQRFTTEEFISKARAIHCDRYDYSLVKYTGANDKVTIICQKHGPFEQTAISHTTGHGCLECSGKTPLTVEVFKKRAEAAHGDRYNYSLIKFVRDKTRVPIICHEHGLFYQNIDVHFKGSGCPKCSYNHLRELYQISTQEFVERAKETHGDRYDYGRAVYLNMGTKVTIICPEHGAFEQIPSDHLRGRGCSGCAAYGFDPTESASLYYLRIDHPIGTFWKIGVTNREVSERFNRDLDIVTILDEVRREDGAAIALAERLILDEFVDERVRDVEVLKNGGDTELFRRDVLGLDPAYPGEANPLHLASLLGVAPEQSLDLNEKAAMIG
jgi:hypothetical protein